VANVPIADDSDGEEEEEVVESKKIVDDKKKLKEFLQMQITETGLLVASKEYRYGRDEYKWCDEDLEYAVFKQRNSKNRKVLKLTEEEEEEDLDSIIGREDLEREREFEYRRKMAGVGDAAQLQPHAILKKTTLRSSTFEWVTEQRLLTATQSPLQRPLHPIFLISYTICDLIFRFDYQPAITQQFEVCLNLFTYLSMCVCIYLSISFH
jgi:hypothetical protein